MFVWGSTGNGQLGLTVAEGQRHRRRFLHALERTIDATHDAGAAHEHGSSTDDDDDDLRDRTAEDNVAGSGSLAPASAPEALVDSVGKLALDALEPPSQPLPVPVSTLQARRVALVAAGAGFSVVATAEGEVFQWGAVQRFNACGEPRDAAFFFFNASAAPAEAASVPTSSADSAAGAPDAGRTVHAGAEAMVPLPRLVKALHDVRVVHLSCGAAHAAALSQWGAVYTWGCGDGGSVPLARASAHSPCRLTRASCVHTRARSTPPPAASDTATACIAHGRRWWQA